MTESSPYVIDSSDQPISLMTEPSIPIEAVWGCVLMKLRTTFVEMSGEHDSWFSVGSKGVFTASFRMAPTGSVVWEGMDCNRSPEHRIRRTWNDKRPRNASGVKYVRRRGFAVR